MWKSNTVTFSVRQETGHAVILTRQSIIGRHMVQFLV